MIIYKYYIIYYDENEFYIYKTEEKSQKFIDKYKNKY